MHLKLMKFFLCILLLIPILAWADEFPELPNTRRYFYPLITEFSAYNEMVNKLEDNLLISKKVSEQVICLPIYSEMEPSSLMKVLSSIC